MAALASCDACAELYGLCRPIDGQRRAQLCFGRGLSFFYIEYIDMIITHDASRINYLAVFSRLDRISKHSGSCLYVHCKSGRDCSAVTLYAFLRLQFGLSSHDAWAPLQFRVGRDKRPVATVWAKREILARNRLGVDIVDDCMVSLDKTALHKCHHVFPGSITCGGGWVFFSTVACLCQLMS